MDTEQVKELVSLLEGSKLLSKLVLKKGDFELRLEKEGTYAPIVNRRPVHIAEAVESVVKPAPVASGQHVKSPMVGTYYASPGPDQKPFIKVGDQVTEETVVCIIEAMKVMNEVKAGVKGTVTEILVDNAQPVEFGTRLIRIG
jgi:acetyl-CoA carboxylase biotin carboxyl carrier protein